MDYSNVFVIIFLIGTAFSFCLNQLLEFIDYKNRKITGTTIPPELSNVLTKENLLQICRYENAKYYFWIPQNIISTALALWLVCSGFYVCALNMIHMHVTQNDFLTLVLFSIISSVPGAVLSLPFELFHEFVLEKKFGFSTMTLKTWITDQVKGIAVNLILISVLFAVMIAIFSIFKTSWWLFLGIAYICISLLISIIYPLFIAPLFNKFTPLEQGTLRDKLEKLLAKCGFKANGLFVMDASKRSKHSNAYFTGFGKSKRVVLYDTLLKQLTEEETEAVLAHELGHYKKHHIIKRLAVMIPVIILALFAAYTLSRVPEVFTAFGFTSLTDSYGTVVQFLGLFLLSLVFGGFTDLTGALGNYFSRRDEFEADAFSAELCGSGQPLSTALIKLNKENMSEISVPKIYSVFNYNHPPLLERLHAAGYKPQK